MSKKVYILLATLSLFLLTSCGNRSSVGEFVAHTEEEQVTEQTANQRNNKTMKIKVTDGNSTNLYPLC